MEYIIGKVISQQENQIIFESNNIGYCLIGNVSKVCKKLFIHKITNIRTLEVFNYAFDSSEKKQHFIELLSIKGFGPASALKLINNNNTAMINDARKTGNIYKLNSEGIKPSILSLIITKNEKNMEAETILIKKSLEKYGFDPFDITNAIKNHYKPNKKIDKNIISIIKAINNAK